MLEKNYKLPEHYSNSNVYMIIVRGTMAIKLNDQESKTYYKGDIISIPYKTKMNVHNPNQEVLEFFVVKSPHPREMVG